MQQTQKRAESRMVISLMSERFRGTDIRGMPEAQSIQAAPSHRLSASAWIGWRP
jgi:hypothetical protein